MNKSGLDERTTHMILWMVGCLSILIVSGCAGTEGDSTTVTAASSAVVQVGMPRMIPIDPPILPYDPLARILPIGCLGRGTPISSVADLEAINSNLSQTYELCNDLDLTGVVHTPIGNATVPFSGTFYGDNHVIRGLNMQSTSAEQGLFGVIVGGKVQGLKLANATVSGGEKVGALVGRMSNSTITSVDVTNSQVRCTRACGLLAGYSYNSNIDTSRSTGEVRCTDPWGGSIGGLVGSQFGASLVSIKNVVVSAFIDGPFGVGGIVGSSFNSTLSRADFTGTIRVSKSQGGGLVGGWGMSGMSTSDQILESAARGNIIWTTDFPYGNSTLGGLVGQLISFTGMMSLPTIKNSYSAMNITGGGGDGGIIGAASDPSGMTPCMNDIFGINSFSYGQVDANLADPGSVSGGLVGTDCNHSKFLFGTPPVQNSYFNGTANPLMPQSLFYTDGLTADQMKSSNSYPGWDFTNTWMMGQSYPVLKWNNVGIDLSNVGFSILETPGPMIIGSTLPVGPSPETLIRPFNVTLKDMSSQPVAGQAVTLDFSYVSSTIHLMTSQEAGTTVDCANHTLTTTTDASGVASFRPRFGGYIESTEVPIVAGSRTLGYAMATSTDLNGASGVSGGDLSIWLGLLGKHTGVAGDFDANGMVSGGDLSLLLGAIGQQGLTSYCP